MVCAEIVRRFVRPSHSEVHSLDENAGPLPLDVHENIYVRAVTVQLLVLGVEYAHHRIVCRSMPFRSVCGVCPDLHLHHIPDDIELEVIPEVQCQHRQRQHVFIGRQLEKCLMVKVEFPKPEVFHDRSCHDAHWYLVLLYRSVVVVVYVVIQQRIPEGSTQIPYRYVQRSFGLGGGNLAETVVPPIVVGMQMLFVIVWFPEVCLKVEVQVERAFPVF